MTPATLIDKAVRLRTESKELGWGDVAPDDDSPKALAESYLTLKEWSTALNQVIRLYADELAKVLPGAPVEVFGELVYYGRKKEEKCIDSAGFHAWLRENPEKVEAAFNADSTRVGAIPKAVRDTFFEKREKGEPVVQSIPLELIGANK